MGAEELPPSMKNLKRGTQEIRNITRYSISTGRKQETLVLKQPGADRWGSLLVYWQSPAQP